MVKKDEFIVKYTNKDIMDKLDLIDNKLNNNQSLARKAMLYATGAIAGFGILLVAMLKYVVFK